MQINANMARLRMGAPDSVIVRKASYLFLDLGQSSVIKPN